MLPALLQARGWSQKRLGEETGIAREDINAICNDKTVGDHRLKKIAEALDLDPRVLREAAREGDEETPTSDLDRLLAEVEASEEQGPVRSLATALRLLTRRLELVERQLAHAAQQASEG